MPRAGVEAARPYGRRILSPLSGPYLALGVSLELIEKDSRAESNAQGITSTDREFDEDGRRRLRALNKQEWPIPYQTRSRQRHAFLPSRVSRKVVTT